MALHYHAVRFAGQLEPDPRGSDALHLIQVNGRGTQVAIPAGWLTLGLPLSGTLELQTPDVRWHVPRGQAFVCRHGALRTATRLPAWWLMLTGAPAAWSRHLPAHAGVDALFPFDDVCPRAIARLLVRTTRKAARGDMPTAASLCDALCAAWLERQSAVQPQLQRCSGRTLQRRQQTLQRLLHVQALIRNTHEDRIDLERLARIANYSPSHLIRLYREVFDETPSEYAARLRFDRAWRLVRETRMPVCEITEALGFESQSAFCRAFKQTFGVTATQARQTPQVDPQALMQQDDDRAEAA